MRSEQDRIESQYFSLLILAMFYISYVFQQYEWNIMKLLMKSKLYVCNLKINKKNLRQLKWKQQYGTILTVHQGNFQA